VKREVAIEIVDSLTEAGVDFVATLTAANLRDPVIALGEDSAIPHMAAAPLDSPENQYLFARYIEKSENIEILASTLSRASATPEKSARPPIQIG